MGERGEIYVLVNRAMPGLVKVGKTRGDSDLRASQLSRGTGVPELFEVIRIYEVLAVDDAERFAHMVLERTNGRPNDRREFFFGPSEKVIEVLGQALLRYQPPMPNELPEAWQIAVEKAKRKQPNLAFAEFEFAIGQGQVPKSLPMFSARVLEALGAYGACCCCLQLAPKTQHLFAKSVSRHAISERMISFLELFQVDEPQRRAIEFMRLIASA